MLDFALAKKKKLRVEKKTINHPMTSYCNTCNVVDASPIRSSAYTGTPHDSPSRYHKLAMQRVEAIKRDLGQRHATASSTQLQPTRSPNRREPHPSSNTRTQPQTSYNNLDDTKTFRDSAVIGPMQERLAQIGDGNAAKTTTTTTTTTTTYTRRGEREDRESGENRRTLSPSQQAAAMALRTAQTHSNKRPDREGATIMKTSPPTVTIDGPTQALSSDAVVASQFSNQWERSLRSPERTTYFRERPMSVSPSRRSPPKALSNQRQNSPSAVRRYFDALATTADRGGVETNGKTDEIFSKADLKDPEHDVGHREFAGETMDSQNEHHSALSPPPPPPPRPATKTDSPVSLFLQQPQPDTSNVRLIQYVDTLRQGFFDLCAAMKEDVSRLRQEQTVVIDSKVRAEVAASLAGRHREKEVQSRDTNSEEANTATKTLNKNYVPSSSDLEQREETSKSEKRESYLTSRPVSRRVDALLKEIKFEDDEWLRSRKKRKGRVNLRSTDDSSSSSEYRRESKHRGSHNKRRMSSISSRERRERKNRKGSYSAESSSSSSSSSSRYLSPTPITYREYKDLSDQFYQFRVSTHKMIENERARSDAAIRGLEGQVVELVKFIEKYVVEGGTTHASLTSPTSSGATGIPGTSALALALKQMKQRAQTTKMAQPQPRQQTPAPLSPTPHTLTTHNSFSSSSSMAHLVQHQQGLRDIEAAVTTKVMKEVQPLMEHLRRLSGAHQQMQSSLIEDQVAKGHAKISSALQLVERDLREQAADIAALRNDTRQALKSVCASVGCALPAL